ncbi:MAG: hypothetical protein HZB36_03405 [Candidatus Omnitrophica bacterium]|nr:hypothetical protein [Candidatus Omnitrophota bacterium]
MFRWLLFELDKKSMIVMVTAFVLFCSLLLCLLFALLLKVQSVYFLLMVAFFCAILTPPPSLYAYSLFANQVKISRDAFEKANQQLIQALAQVKELSGMLPICASCKKIRDDKGYWNKIENYVEAHSSALFTQTACPECVEKLYLGIGVNDTDKRPKGEPGNNYVV